MCAGTIRENQTAGIIDEAIDSQTAGSGREFKGALIDDVAEGIIGAVAVSGEVKRIASRRIDDTTRFINQI